MFTGSEAIEEFLETLDGWLSRSVRVYLLGGSAMAIHGLKDQTKDIDLAQGVIDEFEHVHGTLQSQGFVVDEEPTKSFEGVGRTVQLRHAGLEVQLDLFEQQVVGKVWLSETMQNRADEFWAGEFVTAYVLADEDMFLLKSVAGGDLGSARHRDIADMVSYAQRGLDFDCIIEEIERQRPFNTGTIEATHIRDRSHPLFAIEIATQQVSGLPREFVTRISLFATEFEVEYVILSAVDDGIYHVKAIEERVLDRVQALSAEDIDEVSAGITRLEQKNVLAREGDYVQPLD